MQTSLKVLECIADKQVIKRMIAVQISYIQQGFDRECVETFLTRKRMNGSDYLLDLHASLSLNGTA